MGNAKLTGLSHACPSATLSLPVSRPDPQTVWSKPHLQRPIQGRRF